MFAGLNAGSRLFNETGASRGIKDPIRPRLPMRTTSGSCRHNPLSPIGPAACPQLAAAIPNLAIQEYATGFEADIFESRPEHLGSNVVDEGLFTLAAPYRAAA